MHKTKTGRWQPDSPPKSQREAIHQHANHAVSYDMYLIHRYAHVLHDLHPDCIWCTDCAICQAATQGNPFSVLANVRLP